ncbi:MAG TPA: (d)CMP kinase [Atribacter sp.]|jgi:cytidylate kinase|uniref:Cytidylate kinase n=1 Tax=Candidatus Atribacter allofermentans TaxID=1852833 RepID=A0A1V5T4V7_9BACT|nr:(d)CMP kinase [Atribacter sp.]MDD3713227.1 (d)CMP kinase [Atribacterota bacterium]MDI9595745.1 (d)CMP kinase [Atribacterota bacterium]OQA61252.1 MAG: Cytidylate kinase [Candidatus Atribacteria bacterium ADurb.Bin276]HQK82583.1 (d)CMP kinase [Atribacter sp.]
MKRLIAIDGPAGAGKSTVARLLAKKLSYLYIDTGAMYRAITYFLIKQGINYEDPKALNQALNKMDLHFQVIDGISVIFLNGKRCDEEIRQTDVNQHVSPVAKIVAVRHFLKKKQRDLAQSTFSVTEGRDIGTVVLPDADLKIFLMARPEIRAQRRWKELKEKGIDISYEKVLENVIQRDTIDSTRSEAPLRPADDAMMVDTSDMSIEEVVNFLYQKAVENE